MGKTKNLGHLAHIVTYDASNNITLPANLTVTGTITGYATTASLSSYATQTYVTTQIANLVASAPTTLDTLNELAAALGNDPSFATTIATSIGTKVPSTRTITINGTAYDLSADRSWTISSMIYPDAGIALSTGTGWGTSITNNSANWNTAYGWGNHASAGYLTGITSLQVTTALGFTPSANTHTHAFADLTSKPTTLAGYGITDAASSTHNHNGTYVPVGRTITINGTAYDLSADRSWTVTGTDSTKLPLAGGSMTGRLNLLNTDSLDFALYHGAALSGSARIYYNQPSNQLRIYATAITSDSTTGIGSLALYNGTAYKIVLTESNVSSYAVPLGRTLTINGTAYDLSADRSWTVSASATWSGLSSGYRENYDLGFRPADNSSSYAGFRFASPGNDANAGYLLVRGGADSDVYTQNGLTIVADLGWLTLAQRTTASKGVRIMTGTTSATRISVTDSTTTISNTISVSGDSNFGPDSGADNGIRIRYGATGYGRIRFHQDGTNHSTIHSFGGSSGYTPSVGCINIDAQNGMTVGPWDNPDMRVVKDGLVKILGRGNPIYFTNSWSSYPDSTTNVSEISNDVGSYKRLMIIGNKSAGGDRRVGIWDRLAIAGGDYGYTFSVTGSIYASGDITAYSDARVKTDIQKIEDPIKKIQSINGVTFLRTDEDTNVRHAGVIAQEVLDVLPEVVYKGESGRYSVAYGNLSALFIEAIKEQQKQIEELKSIINGITR